MALLPSEVMDAVRALPEMNEGINEKLDAILVELKKMNEPRGYTYIDHDETLPDPAPTSETR